MINFLKNKLLPLGWMQRSLMNSNEVFKVTDVSSLIFGALYHPDGFTMSSSCPLSNIADTRLHFAVLLKMPIEYI